MRKLALPWSEKCCLKMQLYNTFTFMEKIALRQVRAYIQKTGIACWKIPQKIQIFRRKIVSERENYQFCNVLGKGQHAYSKTKVSWKVLQSRFLVSDLTCHLRTHNKWLYMVGSLWHKAVKRCMPFFCNKRYGMSMIYALLTRNFVVRIYALFPQICMDWKTKSAESFTFWMYAYALCNDLCTF